MLSERDQTIAAEFQRRLKEITPLLDLKIFGSRARGNFDEESDLDVFIKVMNLDHPLRQRISDLAWEVGFEMDRVISTFVVTEEQLQTGALGASPLIYQIEQEGIHL